MIPFFCTLTIVANWFPSCCKDNSVNFKDITDDYACLGIFGPKSRALVSKVFGQHFSNDDFKFGSGKFIQFKEIHMWFQRISYVGELGWEIYIPIEKSKEIYERIVNEEKEFNLVHAGAHSMDIMRMEKGYLHWGHDISPAENPYEANLGFALKLNKKENFIGKDYLIKEKNISHKTLLMFTINDAEPGNPLVLHDEPIFLNNKIVGETTSGNYSFIYDKSMVFGYISTEVDIDENFNKFEIEIANKRYKLNLLKKPLHDAVNKFVKI